MITYEVYGNPKNPILCLLPGAGLGIWAYKQLIPLLTKKFCIIFPNILTNFTDMNNAVQQLHDLIIHKQWRIQLLAGLSIGSQIALKIRALCQSVRMKRFLRTRLSHFGFWSSSLF